MSCIIVFIMFVQRYDATTHRLQPILVFFDRVAVENEIDEFLYVEPNSVLFVSKFWNEHIFRFYHFTKLIKLFHCMKNRPVKTSYEISMLNQQSMSLDGYLHLILLKYYAWSVPYLELFISPMYLNDTRHDYVNF